LEKSFWCSLYLTPFAFLYHFICLLQRFWIEDLDNRSAAKREMVSQFANRRSSLRIVRLFVVLGIRAAKRFRNEAVRMV
jgi:hypothetical protein